MAIARGNEVLVVDDDEMLNKLFCQFVQIAGHRVRSALDGGAALAAAREQPPKLILLDLMLPDMTGFEVCVELRRDHRTQSATIVMVTALSDQESREKGMACGADHYLVKPVDAEVLMSAIQKYAA